MSRRLAKLPPLVIPNGTTVSNALNGNLLYGDATGIMFIVPSGFTATSPILQSSFDGGTTWVALQSGGSNISIIANTARAYNDILAAPFIRISCGAAVVGDQTVYVWKQYEY